MQTPTSASHTFSLSNEQEKNDVRLAISEGKRRPTVERQQVTTPTYRRSRSEHPSFVERRPRVKRTGYDNESLASDSQAPRGGYHRYSGKPAATSRFASSSRNDRYERTQRGFAPRQEQSYTRGASSRSQSPTPFRQKQRKPKAPQFVIQPPADFVPTYAEEKAGSTEPIRLNKFLANSGVCSRRNADLLIAAGKIKVNGEVVTTMGVEITRQDVVEYEGQVVAIEPRVYVLLNKPKNCMTTSDDPEGRITVMDLVKNACKERIYPVGRLDRNTTGVLLLTNDGDMMARLLHPSFEKKKIYQVKLDQPVEVEHMQQIARGISLSDGDIHADAISYIDESDFSVVGIEIHSGRNRIVRRIFEHFGYKILKLDRVYFAGLTKKGLSRGRWRYLTEEEVRKLRMGSYE